MISTLSMKNVCFIRPNVYNWSVAKYCYIFINYMDYKNHVLEDGQPLDAKWHSSGRIFLFHPHTNNGFFLTFEFKRDDTRTHCGKLGTYLSLSWSLSHAMAVLKASWACESTHTASLNHAVASIAALTR